MAEASLRESSIFTVRNKRISTKAVQTWLQIQSITSYFEKLLAPSLFLGPSLCLNPSQPIQCYFHAGLYESYAIPWCFSEGKEVSVDTLLQFTFFFLCKRADLTFYHQIFLKGILLLMLQILLGYNRSRIVTQLIKNVHIKWKLHIIGIISIIWIR